MNQLNRVSGLLLLSSLLSGCLGHDGFSAGSKAVIPEAGQTVVLTVRVTGNGYVNILNEPLLVCDKNADCPVNVLANTETEFQADWDSSDGLQLVSFSGCDLLYASGTICRVTATSAAMVTAVFSKPPRAEFQFSDQGTVVYLTAFDVGGEALTFDSDGTIASAIITSSDGSPVHCYLGGDPAFPGTIQNCLTDDQYFFTVDVDPTLLNLTVTLSVTDDVGLTSAFVEPIRF